MAGLIQAVSKAVEDASWWAAIALFLVFAAYESVQPNHQDRRPATTIRRWFANFVLYAAGLVLFVAIAPERIAILLYGDPGAHSLFAAIETSGGALAVLVTGCLLSDLLIYLTHRVHHAVFFLWRFHSVHHADTELDVSTTLRHHPVEYVGNATLIALIGIGLGLPAWVVPFYATLNIASGLFQHMNAMLPRRLDNALRCVLVTPGMHHTHHSMSPEHYNSNYGAVFSFWDRMFGTELSLSPQRQQSLSYGIADEPRYGLLAALSLPLRLRAASARVAFSSDNWPSDSVETGEAQSLDQPHCS